MVVVCVCGRELRAPTRAEGLQWDWLHLTGSPWCRAGYWDEDAQRWRDAVAATPARETPPSR